VVGLDFILKNPSKLKKFPVNSPTNPPPSPGYAPACIFRINKKNKNEKNGTSWATPLIIPRTIASHPLK